MNINNIVYPWQQDQWASVLELKNLGKLPHAMLVHGSAGVGKSAFTHTLAASLLCEQSQDKAAACGHCHACQLVKAGTHPDLTLIKPVPPQNSKSKQPVLNIRVEAIRDLCKKLSSTSQLGGYRIAVIEGAEKMAMHASNALLKTLEEPGQDILILLVSSHPKQLAVTIRSRCQAIRFAEPDRQQALAWLEAQGIQGADRWLNYAHGAPLLALHYAEEQGDQRQLLAKALLASSNGEALLPFAKKLADLPKEDTLVWLVEWIGDVIKLKHSRQEIPLINEDFREKLLSRAENCDTRAVFAFYDQICHHIRQEGIALNNQLLWENLLISWDNL